MYWHLFLDRYLYFLNIHDSNKTHNVRCRYIVIAQHNKKMHALWVKRLDDSRVVQMLGNTYTGLVDVMLCTKSKVLTMAGHQARHCFFTVCSVIPPTCTCTDWSRPGWPCCSTRWDGWITRASISHFGRSGNPNITDSNHGRVKSMTFKLILVAS